MYLTPYEVNRAEAQLDALNLPALSKRVADIARRWHEGLPALRQSAPNLTWDDKQPIFDYVQSFATELWHVWSGYCDARPIPEYSAPLPIHDFDMKLAVDQLEREAVHPGQILAIQGGSFNAMPIDDDKCDGTTFCPLGVCMSAAKAFLSDELQPGCANVETRPGLVQRVAIFSAISDHCRLGVPLADAWLNRAEAARHVLRGKWNGWGAPEFTQQEWDCARLCLLRVLQASGTKLLGTRPAGAMPKALVTVIRSKQPTSEMIDEAMTEVMCIWAKNPALPTGVAPAAKSSRKRKTRVESLDRPLTAVELHTMEVVARHGNNFAAAARQLGRDPKTVKENFKRGSQKLARQAGGKSRSARANGGLREDRRGQPTVTAPE